MNKLANYRSVPKLLIHSKRHICCLIILLAPLGLSAQNSSHLSGSVKDGAGNPIEFAYVYLVNTQYSITTGHNGEYSLTIPPGEYTLACSYLGYKTSEREIKVSERQRSINNFVLEINSNNVMEAVVVVGQSQVRQVRETAYNVVAIDAKALHNRAFDLAHALDRTSGVKIREAGGVGSNSQISLNGYTGKHIKVFMDGMPMEGFGSSFQIGNIPVNMAERIEVYKGVVPVELGADALGGAINIITKQSPNTFLDASYSYGSFNTHKSNISMGYTSPKGVLFQVNAFQNYSDNNYKIKSQLVNLETGNYSKEEYWFRRFHDNYHNEAVIIKTGVVNRSWANRLIFSMTMSQEKADIQNTNIMKIVFGGKMRKSKSVVPSINYQKQNLFVKNMNLSVTANYNMVHNNNIDTLARQYNWKGEYRTKGSKGEGQYSLSEFNNKSFASMANLSYRPGERHYISVNNVYSTYSRKATDAAASSGTGSAAEYMKRSNSKNVLGFSYKFAPTKTWNISTFGKYYSVNTIGPVNISITGTEEYVLQSRSFNTNGYGGALTRLMKESFQIKLSFEQSYRLPSERELFGDEVLESGDHNLKPENSKNINLNLTLNKDITKTHSIYLDAGFTYRDTRDYIRRLIDQRYGGASYTNHGKVRNLGVDVEARYFYSDKFSVGGNLTYQDIRNMERFLPNGQEAVIYKDRMPNVPYLFGNADASYNIHNLWGEGNLLSIGYNLRYINLFFRDWQGEGGRDIKIPTQLSHDIDITYAIQNGKYNISFSVKNITDEILYDNYSLQKPGRSFFIKLRYFFFENN